jgi:hypothetical protein
VPFQGVFFFGDGFPMALPWAGREVPLAGRQIWRKSAPLFSTNLAKVWAGFLNKAERLIHGTQIASHPENADKWYYTNAQC